MEAFDRGIFVGPESGSRKRCGRAQNVGFTRRWYANSWKELINCPTTDRASYQMRS